MQSVEVQYPTSNVGQALENSLVLVTKVRTRMLLFQEGLLLRAKETYSKRSVGNKYDIISKWLLTGLAVMITRSNWNILPKRRTLTITPRNLLRTYFRWGYPADDEDRSRKPYALPHPRSLLVGTWEATVSSISHEHYVQATATVTNLDVFGPLGVR